MGIIETIRETIANSTPAELMGDAIGALSIFGILWGALLLGHALGV